MPSATPRRDCVSRVIAAPRRALYLALMDDEALVRWLPPSGMTAHVESFDGQVGGGYRMTLTYTSPGPAARGKTSAVSDVVDVTFVELVPDTRIVERVAFVSRDPSFAGAMTMTWTFADAPGGTEVTVLAENAPAGVTAADHETGMRSSLENLAAFVV